MLRAQACVLVEACTKTQLWPPYSLGCALGRSVHRYTVTHKTASSTEFPGVTTLFASCKGVSCKGAGWWIARQPLGATSSNLQWGNSQKQANERGGGGVAKVEGWAWWARSRACKEAYWTIPIIGWQRSNQMMLELLAGQALSICT